MNKLYKLLTLLLLCALVPMTGLLAQETDDDEVIELSPFVVTGDDDIGYQATSTLAGTRLRTNLNDVATSISIVNEEFLNDTGSTNIEDVLVLTPNTEIGGLAGNFSGSQGSGAGNSIPELQRDNQQGGVSRIRGLSSADLTRDYFITDVPFDTFNTDRIAIQRGANSALFGLGSPGGIVNNSTIKADYLGNRGQVKLETDQYGTRRGSFRYNAEIIDDRLAIFVAGLHDDQQYEQREAYEVDERLYASVTLNITDNIRLHVSGETGERDSARPDYIPPNDGITPWILAGKPIAEDPLQAAQLFRGTGDFFPAEASNSTNSRLLSVDTSGASSGFVEYFHNVGSPYATFGGTPFVRADQGTPGNAEYMQIRVRPMIRTMKLTGGYWPGGGSVAPGTDGFYSSGNVDLQILDRSIYDYRKHLFSGGASTQGSDWDIVQGTLEGTWWENRVGVEVAAYKQKMNTWGFNMLQGIDQRTIYIDINKYLIAPDPNGGWVPNPSFGKPTMGGGYGGNWLASDRESVRATAFIDLKAEDFMDESWVSRLLGSFKGTGVYQERVGEGEQNYGGRGGIDAQVTADALYGGDIFGEIGANYANYYKGMQFTLPSNNNIDYLSATSINDVRGANIGAVPYGTKRSNFQSQQTFIGWNTVTDSFVNFTTPVYTLRDLDGNGPARTQTSFYSGKSKTEIDSQVLVGQWYLWDNLVVLTGTWRNDVQRSGSVGAPRWDPYNDGRSMSQSEDTTDPAYVAGVKNVSEDADEDTKSWGIVVHSPDFINDLLPWGTNLSIYKSKADNFQPSGSRVNIYNEQIAPVTGSTEEWGFIVSSLDNKLNARFNWFETSILNNSFDVGGVSNSEGILNGLAQQLDNPANIAQGFTAADAQAVLPPQGVIDVNGFVPNWPDATSTTNRSSSDNGTQDFTAEGMEIEISYNPTPNWTLLLTVARQETVTSNTYPVLTRYVNDFVIPNWVNSSFAQNYFINEDATTTLAEQAMTTIVEPVLQAATSDGIPTIEQREWRWSLNTSYNFGSNNDLIPEWFGNLTIGGGVRWQDEIGIGYGVGVNEFGNLAKDPGQPFYGPSQTFVDVFARTQYELKNDMSLILQVNIKDLMDNDDLVPFYANPNGMKLYRFMQGRLVTCSATLKF